MPRLHGHIAQVFVKVGGSDLPAKASDRIVEVIVDQNIHLPDMAIVRIHDEQDPTESNFPIIDGGFFALGDELEVTSPEYDITEGEYRAGTPPSLFKGEVVSLEPNFDQSMNAVMIVRAYDKSHRGYREVKTQAFTDERDSGAMSSLANFGVSGNVTSTSETYTHLAVDNQSPLEFIKERAWRHGFKTDIDEQGTTLEVKAATTSDETITVTYGKELTRFNPRVSGAEIVTEVSVRGWDPTAQKAIVGKSTKSTDYVTNNFGKATSSASKFGTSKMVIVDHPVKSQAEAKALADARMNELAGTFVTAEGEAVDTPQIRAGKKLKIEGVGDSFSGDYLVTQATHRYTIQGFETRFEVRGSRSGTMVESMGHQSPKKRWPGVYPAKVTDTTDPDKLGRAKVTYPWLDDNYVSDWARIVFVGGGQQGALISLPEIDDEVLIAFEHGDINRPYILGGILNGKFKPPNDIPGATKRANGRIWYSKNGHRIAMYDAGDSGIDQIKIETAGGRKMTINDKDQNFELKTTKGITFKVDDKSGDITIDGGNNIDINAKANITIKAKGNIKMEAMGNMDLKATGNATMKATGMLTTEATGNATHQANGMMTVKTSAILTIQGSLVKIN